MISMRSRSGPGIVSSWFAGSDEHHLRQVEIHAKVIVAKLRVLLRIEHFQQRTARVAMEAARAELVDLVEHDHAVARFRRLIAWMMLPGNDPMYVRRWPADLRFVMRTAERHALELAFRRPRDRLTERGLPTPGGPTKHRIGLLPSGLSLRTARYSRMRRLILSRP